MFVVSQILERVARVTRRAVAAACVAGALLAMCEGLGRAACPSPPYTAQCSYPCDEPTGGPIRILFLGAAAVPAWIPAALSPSGVGPELDCNGCPMVAGVDYVAMAVTWAVASTWPPESFRSFDVLVTDTDSGTSYAPPYSAEPWRESFRQARRVVATALHVNTLPHLGTHNALREVVQNVMTWIAADECCTLPRGMGVIPGVFVAGDTASTNALRYTPWPGVTRSYSRGVGSDFGCVILASHDDTVFIGTHPIFTSVNDQACGTCGANNACSLDNSKQSVHAVWMQGHAPCGYEDDGFVAVQRVEIVAPELLPGGSCVAQGPGACVVTPVGATTATIIRERPCCGEVEPVPSSPGAGCP